MKARIAEIFKSIQGEGIYQGKEQLFVRFYGCNLKCRFCDTPLIHYEELDTDELLSRIKRFGKDYHSLSLTGGEPLLQSDFLKEMLALLKQSSIKIYLETNGILYRELSKVIDYIDIIAMDFKLPSSTALPAFWDEHKKFLSIALRKEVFVKAVICQQTGRDDIRESVNLIRYFRKDIPFILQPEFSQMKDRGLKDILWDYKNLASSYLKDVRILPQLHKLQGVK